MSLRNRKYIGAMPFFRTAVANGKGRDKSCSHPASHGLTLPLGGSRRWADCHDLTMTPVCGWLMRRPRRGVNPDTGRMPVRLHHIVVDAHDLPGLARFWAQALGWEILSEREREIVIGTDDEAPVGMCFMPVTGPKTVKNRVHLDLTSSAEDREQEIERLLALGARRVDIGQAGTESWTVLADPEGNEFCVVRPKRTLTR